MRGWCEAQPHHPHECITLHCALSPASPSTNVEVAADGKSISCRTPSLSVGIYHITVSNVESSSCDECAILLVYRLSQSPDWISCPPNHGSMLRKGEGAVAGVPPALGLRSRNKGRVVWVWVCVGKRSCEYGTVPGVRRFPADRSGWRHRREHLCDSHELVRFCALLRLVSHTL